jgi:hypothetical protein
MKKPRNHTATVILGVITALIIVLSQVFYYQGAGYCTTAKGTIEQHDQAGQPEQSAEKSRSSASFISLPSITVLSSFHAAFQHPSIFLFELTSNGEEPESWTPEISIFLGKYFQTLFHIIISPNAP